MAMRVFTIDQKQEQPFTEILNLIYLYLTYISNERFKIYIHLSFSSVQRMKINTITPELYKRTSQKPQNVYVNPLNFP
jgi:hypothetical protein